MAVTNPTVYRLSIALIVFVLLTFILTITTYLFFKQRMDEQLRATDAQKNATEKQEALLNSQQEAQKLREIIGAADGTTVEAIETDLNNLFTRDFAGFREDPKSYTKLISWIRDEFRRKDAEVKASEEKSKQATGDGAAAKAQASAATDAALKATQEARDLQAKNKQEFDQQWAGHEGEQKKLLEQKEAAEKRADRLDMLISAIADGGQYLTPNRQKDFKAKDSAEDKLGLIYAELRERDKVINEQNRVLAALRVADRGLQEQVLAATPKDDRIDGFDGRILSVDERERSVLVSCSTTRGIRPGMILHVFGPDEARPQAGDRKAVVEVTAVEGPSLVRATIRRDSIQTPILAGDGVATSLWAAGTAPEVVIVGYVNMDDSGGSDRDRLVALVERAGARVVDAVTPLTAMVVDGGKPPSIGDVDAEKRFSEKEGRQQRATLDTARQYGVRVVGVEALLDMLGLTREALTSNRLPGTAAAR
jgi:hypothetical protein